MFSTKFRLLLLNVRPRKNIECAISTKFCCVQPTTEVVQYLFVFIDTVFLAQSIAFIQYFTNRKFVLITHLCITKRNVELSVPVAFGLCVKVNNLFINFFGYIQLLLNLNCFYFLKMFLLYTYCNDTSTEFEFIMQTLYTVKFLQNYEGLGFVARLRYPDIFKTNLFFEVYFLLSRTSLMFEYWFRSFSHCQQRQSLPRKKHYVFFSLNKIINCL